MSEKINGKAAVVTGGAQGIGRVLCRELVSRGMRVVVADSDETAGEETLEFIHGQAGVKALFVKCDVALEEDVKRLFSVASEVFGGVDMLINNAGIGAGGDIFTRSIEEWDRVIAVNLRGTYMCSKYAAESMRSRGGGTIINICSTRAFMSEPDTEPYSASKGGILALTHSLAVSLGQYGIRVNSISPGWIDVSGLKKKDGGGQDILSEADHKQHPAGRVGKAEDIASACIYLASEEAGFITGTNLTVDGGMTVKMIYV